MNSKLIGIDYGSQRVGVAISDDRGAIAFPKGTYKNDRTLLPCLIDLIKKENARTIVIGESTHQGADNPIMQDARTLAAKLKQALAITVAYEPEFYTSVEARRDTGKKEVDAEAAAIMLNSYLARKKNP